MTLCIDFASPPDELAGGAAVPDVCRQNRLTAGRPG